MAHNIKHIDYHCSVSQKQVQKRLDNYVACEDYEEGASGLPQPIRWINHLCKNREEAMEYILDLAIELPVYQRSVLYAYNSNVISADSLPKEVNPYSSPLDRIWEVEFAK